MSSGNRTSGPRSGLPAGENPDTYGKEPGVVQDAQYEKLERKGMEEFKPEDPTAAQPTRRDMPDLRESTKNTPEGAFKEDESLMGEGASGQLGPEKEKDTERQLSINRVKFALEKERKKRELMKVLLWDRMSSLVAASHREGRSEEEKRASAEKASKLSEDVGEGPLEINKQGEIVTE